MPKLKKGDGVPFTQIANIVLCNPNISAKAKGLYSYIQSKPDNWDFSVKRITADFLDGENGIRSGLKELEAIGLLVREKQNTGRVVYTIYVEQKPDDQIHIQRQKPDDEKAKQAKSQTGETITISNKDSDKETKRRKKQPPNPQGGSAGKLVESFFILKGWEYDKTKQALFRRHLRGAKDLLELCDEDINLATHKLNQIKYWADSKNLEWSIETVLKKWYDLDLLSVRVEAEKKSFIGNDRAYKNNKGRWHVILPNGEHKEYIGSLDALRYGNS